MTQIPAGKKAGRLIILFALAMISASLILKVPPENYFIIIILIGAVAAFFSLASSFFLDKKYSILVLVSVFLFLIMNFLAGFQVINTLLLLSGIIGIILLLKRSKNHDK